MEKRDKQKGASPAKEQTGKVPVLRSRGIPPIRLMITLAISRISHFIRKHPLGFIVLRKLTF